MARILIHTLGSSGDLNPFLALGLELKHRGHAVRFAISPTHAAIVENLGMDAVAIGPDFDPNSDLMRKMLRPEVVGPIDTLFRNVLIPSIGPAADAIEPLARESDIFLSHIVQLAAPVIAHRSGVKWISATPTANCYPSRCTDAPGIAWKNPPAVINTVVWTAVRGMLSRLDGLIEEQYRLHGGPPAGNGAILGSYSKLLTIGMWSPAFFPRPADWPEWFNLGGYARWDAPLVKGGHLVDRGSQCLPIPQGESPLIVFTLGSSVVNDPRGYFHLAIEAVRKTDWRAVLLGAPDDFPVPAALATRVSAIPYAPYADLFPLASAIVHQGGVGTTQAACYYGVPAIVVPRGFDQFENAAHIQRNGFGLRLSHSSLSPTLLTIRIERLLASRDIQENVTVLSNKMQAEGGAGASADLIEEIVFRS